MHNAIKTVRPYFLILLFIVISNSYAGLVAYWDFNAGSGDTENYTESQGRHDKIQNVSGYL